MDAIQQDNKEAEEAVQRYRDVITQSQLVLAQSQGVSKIQQQDNTPVLVPPKELEEAVQNICDL